MYASWLRCCSLHFSPLSRPFLFTSLIFYEEPCRTQWRKCMTSIKVNLKWLTLTENIRNIYKLHISISRTMSSLILDKSCSHVERCQAKLGRTKITKNQKITLQVIYHICNDHYYHLQLCHRYSLPITSTMHRNINNLGT